MRCLSARRTWTVPPLPTNFPPPAGAFHQLVSITLCTCLCHGLKWAATFALNNVWICLKEITCGTSKRINDITHLIMWYLRRSGTFLQRERPILSTPEAERLSLEKKSPQSNRSYFQSTPWWLTRLLTWLCGYFANCPTLWRGWTVVVPERSHTPTQRSLYVFLLSDAKTQGTRREKGHINGLLRS